MDYGWVSHASCYGRWMFYHTSVCASLNLKITDPRRRLQWHLTCLKRLNQHDVLWYALAMRSRCFRCYQLSYTTCPHMCHRNVLHLISLWSWQQNCPQHHKFHRRYILQVWSLRKPVSPNVLFKLPLMSVLFTQPRVRFRIIVQMTTALPTYSSSWVLRRVGQGQWSAKVAYKMIRRPGHSTLSLFSKPISYPQHLEIHVI